MDYVWEELLRQHKVLAALMAGGTPEESRKKAGGETEARRREMAWNRAAGPDAGAPELPAVLAETFMETQPWMQRQTGVESSAAQARGRTAPSSAARARGQTMMSAAPRQAGRAAGSLGGSERSDRMEAVIAYAAAGGRETADARALSRAVQRDARRYDGGFSIY